MQPPPPGTPRPSGRSATQHGVAQEWSDALERAVDFAVLAPSVHDTQPWHLELRPGALLIRADRSRQVTATDPSGRELVQAVGAALLNTRVALAADGYASVVDRLPDPADPDLLAVVRPAPGVPDPDLAALAPAVPLRRTDRRTFTADAVPDGVLRGLIASAAAEGAVLVPVLNEVHRRLLARLTQQADRIQNADPAYRAQLRRWTDLRPGDGDGVPATAGPHVDGRAPDDVRIRDVDSAGAGALPAETSIGVDQTVVLLATGSDDRPAWLRCGEAMQRVLLELTGLGWSGSPLTQLVEVPLTRTQLRSALSWDAHPQLLLRIGRADGTPRRRRDGPLRTS
jgi:nitroreductase